MSQISGRRSALGLVVLLLWMISTSAWAHDPLEATVDIEVRSTELAFHITMARSVAAYLTGFGENPRIYFPPENFPANQEKFNRTAATLCSLRIGPKTLEPSGLETKLTSESDVEFVLTYPAPVQSDLQFEAKWFARLPPHGFAGIFAVKTKGYHLPGRLLLFAERPSQTFRLLEDPAPKGVTPSS